MTNSVMMPLAALATCFLILRTVGFDEIAREIEQSSAFQRKKLYMVFMKYLCTDLPDHYSAKFYCKRTGNYHYVMENAC